jgi:hypothetical protein
MYSVGTLGSVRARDGRLTDLVLLALAAEDGVVLRKGGGGRRKWPVIRGGEPMGRRRGAGWCDRRASSTCWHIDGEWTCEVMRDDVKAIWCSFVRGDSIVVDGSQRS